MLKYASYACTPFYCVDFLAFIENEFSVATENLAGVSPVDPIDKYHDNSLSQMIDTSSNKKLEK